MAYLNLLLGVLETVMIQFCMYWFLSHNDRTRYLKKGWYLLMFFLGGVLMMGFNFIPGIRGWGTLVLHLGEILVFGRVGFHRGMNAMVWDVLFFLMQFLLMEIGIFLPTFLNTYIRAENYLLIGNLCMAVKGVLLFLGTMGMVLWMKKMKRSQLLKKQLLLIIIFPLMSLFLFITILKMSQIYAQFYGLGIVVADILILIFMNAYFLFLLRYLYRNKELEREMEVSRVQSEIQYRYYGELEKSYQKSRKVLHDMKNHLQLVERLYHESDHVRGDAYVKDLYHMLNVLGEKYYTSDRLLNIILNEKLEKAKRDGIEVSILIGDVSFSDIKDIDMTTIFANLLDNALEAAEQADKKVLDIKIDQVHDFRVICIVNGCPEETKKKRRHQGLGLDNVSQTLVRYHGSIQTEKINGEFRVNIMLPQVMEKKEGDEL